MARIFDVIEYPDEMRTEIVHRFPESGSGDFHIGSQVIVRESQNAVFFRDGKALDTFTAGRHTITTANVPYLIDYIGKAFNDRTPFTAEVYFVSIREFADQKWGTPQPIIIRNPGMGLGVALMQGFGSYSFNVTNPQQFVAQIVGATGAYTTADIQGRLRAILLSKMQDLLGEVAAKKSVPELIGLTEELGAGVRAKAQDDFQAVGLTLKSFYIENLKPSEKSAEELRAMGMLDMATYTQLQAADAMRAAASNPSGGAGLTAGIGAGVSLGQIMGQALQGGMASGQGANTTAAGAAAGAMADIMTISDVAAQLKVGEEDVLGLITNGELKAKKIGASYRVTKAQLTEYMGK
jgi:excisionase family DNA binding protein